MAIFMPAIRMQTQYIIIRNNYLITTDFFLSIFYVMEQHGCTECNVLFTVIIV